MSVQTDSQQLVVFSLANEEYALPITRVQEIIRYTEPRTVASDVAWIRGVISLRGKIVPVYDLCTRLGLSGEPSESSKIVIVETGDDMAGVIVDDVEEVLTVDGEQVEEVPAASSDAIDGIAKVGDRLVVLLNPEGIFTVDTPVAA